MQDIDFKAGKIESLSKILEDEKKENSSRFDLMTSRHDEERTHIKE